MPSATVRQLRVALSPCLLVVNSSTDGFPGGEGRAETQLDEQLDKLLLYAYYKKNDNITILTDSFF